MCDLHQKDSCFCKEFIIKGFLETSFVDWPGKLCSVMFLPSCNFRCSYCHNSELVLHPDMIANIPFDQVIERLQDMQGWIDGVCVSGGEPTIHPFLPHLLQAIRQQGLLTKLDTNGGRPEMLAALLNDKLIDYIAMDIKAPLAEDAYCKVTGVRGMTENVKKSIDIIRTSNVPYEFRFTVLPSYHQPEDIFRVAEALCGATKLKLQNFKPAHTLDPLLNTCRSYDAEDITIYQQKVDQIISRQVH